MGAIAAGLEVGITRTGSDRAEIVGVGTGVGVRKGSGGAEATGVGIVAVLTGVVRAVSTCVEGAGTVVAGDGDEAGEADETEAVGGSADVGATAIASHASFTDVPMLLVDPL